MRRDMDDREPCASARSPMLSSAMERRLKSSWALRRHSQWSPRDAQSTLECAPEEPNTQVRPVVTAIRRLLAIRWAPWYATPARHLPSQDSHFGRCPACDAAEAKLLLFTTMVKYFACRSCGHRWRS